MAESATLNANDLQKIDNAIKLGTNITITTYDYHRAVQKKLDDLVGYFLEKIQQAHLKDYALYCMNELAINAKKANTKRIFFREHGLDIFDPVQYKMGIESFKKETLENIDHYTNMQKEAGLYVKIILHANENSFTIEVRNNVVMTNEEKLRIQQKLATAQETDDMAEAMANAIDETEGAGLGLIIMTLMLRQIGASSDAYSIEVIKDETVSKITLPFSAHYVETVHTLSDEIIKQINQIPQFPQKIVELQKLINDPDVEITDIAKTISNDVGITTDLLKLVNSVAFGLKAKCSNIAEAVKLVGIRGIQNLLYSIGTMNIFTQTGTTEEQQALWQHSYKVGYFSYNLARVLRIKSIIDDAYVCGLLHDVGKLVVSGLYPDVLNTISRIQRQQKIPKQLIDIITSGMHHAEIGAKLTEKWNFPKQISASILYHHNLAAVPKEFFQITATIALANYLVHYSDGMVNFEQIPKKVLEAFKIENEAVVKKIAANFTAGFSEEQAYR